MDHPTQVIQPNYHVKPLNIKALYFSNLLTNIKRFFIEIIL
jgi:hypothetical protein